VLTKYHILSYPFSFLICLWSTLLDIRTIYLFSATCLCGISVFNTYSGLAVTICYNVTGYPVKLAYVPYGPSNENDDCDSMKISLSCFACYEQSNWPKKVFVHIIIYSPYKVTPISDQVRCHIACELNMVRCHIVDDWYIYYCSVTLPMTGIFIFIIVIIKYAMHI
jgi:hypothetical protein